MKSRFRNQLTRQQLIRRVRSRLLKRLLLAAVALAGATLVGAVLFVAWGVYNVSALQQHTGPVYRLLNTALDRSISQRAEGAQAPPLDDPALARQGLRYYQEACVQCHGAPGVARHAAGRGLTPVPPNLAHAARVRSPEELFWAIKHGIKMTGMPSWQFTYSDQQIWAIVAFVERMPALSVEDYREFAAGEPPPEPAPARPATLPKADAQRGKLALYGYACTACHRIPGLVGPGADVGPPLKGIGERRYIAGVLTNNVDNMVRWIREPDQVDPLTTMPDLDVTEQDARDMAEYLRSLE